MSNYYNEAGEPLMDGAAMRYEMYLDSMYEPDPDDFYRDEPDEPECDEDHECDACSGPGGIWDRDGVFTPHPGQVWRCSWCDRPCPPGAHED